MKNYRITVNGVAYEVAVEELGADEVTAAPAAAAKPAAKAAPAKKAPKKAPAGGAGSVQINAPMPGKILAVKANEGTAVSKGDVVLILEAMKMENEICAPQDGTIASIEVSVGDMVESGNVLATMN
ncbi:MAG: biotin/lipoyl-binding protein [Clostridiales bacterium]|nr:biotin/lipoyl-binding protein [Clostridiales bacterium]